MVRGLGLLEQFAYSDVAGNRAVQGAAHLIGDGIDPGRQGVARLAFQ